MMKGEERASVGVPQSEAPCARTKLPQLSAASREAVNELILATPPWRKGQPTAPAILGSMRNGEPVMIKLLVDGWRYAVVDAIGWRLLHRFELTDLPMFWNLSGARDRAYVRVRPLAADALYGGHREAPLTVARILMGIGCRTRVCYRNNRQLDLRYDNLYLASSDDAKRHDKRIAKAAAESLRQERAEKLEAQGYDQFVQRFYPSAAIEGAADIPADTPNIDAPAAVPGQHQRAAALTHSAPLTSDVRKAPLKLKVRSASRVSKRRTKGKSR